MRKEDWSYFYSEPYNIRNDFESNASNAMADKQNYTITSRYRAQKAPRGKMTIAPGEFVTSRLSISLPLAKETWTYDKLVKSIDGAPDGTLFFLDTSIYKYERNEQVWMLY